MSIEKDIQSKFRNEYHKAFVNIYYTNCFISSQFQKVLKQQDITQQQFNILRILRGQYPKAASVGLIKERMLDKNSDVSRIVERLRIKKLVERRTSRKDRRQMDVKVSDSGLDMLAQLDKYEKEMDSIFSHLSDKEVKSLNKILDKIRDK